MNIRKAEERDIPRITEIYAGARAFMAAHGNPTQWNDGYPDEACIRADMKADTLHVIERDGKIAGVFALITRGPSATRSLTVHGTPRVPTAPSTASRPTA